MHYALPPVSSCFFELSDTYDEGFVCLCCLCIGAAEIPSTGDLTLQASLDTKPFCMILENLLVNTA